VTVVGPQEIRDATAAELRARNAAVIDAGELAGCAARVQTECDCVTLIVPDPSAEEAREALGAIEAARRCSWRPAILVVSAKPGWLNEDQWKVSYILIPGTMDLQLMPKATADQAMYEVSRRGSAY